MPELPEVQTIVNDLVAILPGKQITGATIGWQSTVGGDGPAFLRQVSGCYITGVQRRGKYIVIPLEAPKSTTLLVHLRMSGRLFVAMPEEERSGYERVILYLDDRRELRFYDPRKFGRMVLTQNPDAVLGRLGVEPLSGEFSPAVLGGLLEGRRRLLKPLLLDQHIIAGLGNIYVDEALWEARIHPLRHSTTLTKREIAALAAAIRHVLLRGIRNLGTTLGTGKTNFVLPLHNSSSGARNQEELQVFQQTGRPCPRCGAPIKKIVVGQRGTHLCPYCQQR